jgi:hypothetical protein
LFAGGDVVAERTQRRSAGLLRAKSGGFEVSGFQGAMELDLLGELGVALSTTHDVGKTAQQLAHAIAPQGARRTL